MKSITRILPALFALAVLFPPLQSEASEPTTTKVESRPNILFAIADDWGWPHAGAYGDPVCKTPTFDQVAREGILFKHAFISSPSCTPSRNAILTGQHFWRLGGGANLHSVLDTKYQSFVHILGDNGYSIGHMRKMWGPGNASNWEMNPAGLKFKDFEDFLSKRDSQKPFCFCLGAYDPHRGYKAGGGKESGMKLSDIKLFDCFPDATKIRSDVADYYFEVQRFDREVGAAFEKLRQLGELENTIVIVTGDHGMPFPRCKSNLYDSGSRVPMAVRWPKEIKSGRTVSDFVSTTDLAPTILQAAGVTILDAMTGKSWLPIFQRSSNKDTATPGPNRSHIIFGKERHVPSQEAPDYGGYPMRAIRTAKYLLIENHRPDRWPNGTPNYLNATIPHAWLADTDNGPTKSYIVKNRDKDDHHKLCYDLCFAKRPRFELYDCVADPEQLTNLADSPEHVEAKNELHKKLMAELLATNDPRAKDSDAATQYFDAFKYLGNGPRHPSWKKKKPAKK